MLPGLGLLQSALPRKAFGFGITLFFAQFLAALFLAAPAGALGQEIRGRVSDLQGEPLVGAMVSFRQGEPFHETTVFSDAEGRYSTTLIDPALPFSARARRIGWRDQRLSGEAPTATQAPGKTIENLDFVLERETDPAQLAAQLPANRWYALLLESLDDPSEREELVRQCTYCHQQGNWATRRPRQPEEWRKVLALMARMGGILSPE